MSGLIQRLLDRGGASLPASPAPDVASVTSAARSQSPMAEHDQRLQDPGFRGLMGMLLTSAYEPAPNAPEAEPAAPTAATMRPSRRDALKPAAPSWAAMPDNAPARDSIPASANPGRPPAGFDPIAALRRAATEPPSAAQSEVSHAGPLQITPPPPDLQESVPPPARIGAVSTNPPPSRETTARLAREPVQPPISDRLPTDPPIIDALPPKPAPKSLSAVDMLSPTLKAEPKDSRAPGPSAANGAAEPRPVRPVAPRPAVEAAPTVGRVPKMTAPSPERIIERIVREVESKPAPAPERRQSRPRVTANSVSKIGALPERRRAHTLFGLRRG
jgi:hypothetical protein